MWLAGSSFGRVSDAYLGTRQVCLQRRGETLLCEGVTSWEAGLGLLMTALEGGGRGSVRLWLSGGLCRPFLVSAVDGVESSQEWELIAQSLAADATGLAGPCDVWLERVAADRRLAVAIDQRVKQQIVKSLGGRLQALGPWWNAVQRVERQNDSRRAMLAVLDCDSVTMLRCDAGASQDWIHAQSTMVGDQDALAVINRLRMGIDWPHGDDVPLVRLRRAGATADPASPNGRSRATQAVFVQETA